MVTSEDFAEFFAEVNEDRQPFSWQQRLVDHILTTGSWPDRINAPTGSGKSCVVEVHIFVTAAAALSGDVRPPRRLVAAVDRRALVDNQLERALAIQEKLTTAKSGVLKRIKTALVSLWSQNGRSTESGLQVVSLRGGQASSAVWRDAPEACGIICATPDMWGSRILFRGYGTTRRGRPRDAGLLAVDTVLVLDEAHLNRQLLRTARRVADLQHLAGSLGVPGLQVAETTATPGSPNKGDSATEIGVREQDVTQPAGADQELAKRLQTPKPFVLVPSSEWPGSTAPTAKKVVNLIAERARALKSDRTGTVGVFVNTVNRALDVAELLRAPLGREGREPTVAVVVGPMRPCDRDDMKVRWRGLLSTAGNPDVDYLVATQTLEVGVDLDLPVAVSELAPADSITQRAGRVNRLGCHAHPLIELIVPEDIDSARLEGAAGPYVREDLASALSWLQVLHRNPSGLSPWAIREHKPPAGGPKRHLYQRLEAADVSIMAATSQPLFDEFDLELWLHDELERQNDQSFLVVRERLPADSSEALAVLKATPPLSFECFPTTLGTLRHVLNGEQQAPRAFRFRGGETTELASPAGPRLGDVDLRPGDIVIVDASLPIMRENVIHREPLKTAEDVYERGAEQSDLPGIRIMPFPDRLPDEADPYRLLLRELGTTLTPDSRDTVGRRRSIANLLGERLDDIVAVLDAGDADVMERRVRQASRALVRAKYLTELSIGHDQNGQLAWVVITPLRDRLPSDLRQIVSPNPNDEPVPLAQHAQAVAERAAELGLAIGVRAPLPEILEWAGRHHDDGKQDLRFQRVLRDADSIDETLLAKSRRRRTSTARQHEAQLQPAGWRHEQLSVVIAAGTSDSPFDMERRQLALRLVGTSHGHGRPAFPHAAVELVSSDDPSFESARKLFDRGGWDDLIEATEARWGAWGCAFLEALLRAADCQVSSEGS